uniref:Uncharacterized protein n=1 Tax=Mesocestoides corti TaxID=53468 RepID=A0A5K3F4V1_MESCO
MTEMTQPDIQLVRVMLQSCLSERPCASLSTHFYRVGDSDPEYNITISYPPATSISTRSILFSFQLSTDDLELHTTDCIQELGVFAATRIYGPVHFPAPVLHADVVFGSGGRLRLSNSGLGFATGVTIPAYFDGQGFSAIVQKFENFIDEQC